MQYSTWYNPCNVIWGGRDPDGRDGSGVGDVGGGDVEGEVGGTDGLVGGSDGSKVGGRGAGDLQGDLGKSNSCHVPGINAIGRSQVAVNVTVTLDRCSQDTARSVETRSQRVEQLEEES